MSWLYTAPLVLLAAVIIASLLGAMELGHRLSQIAPVEERQASTTSGPILALVGLLLAFSFSMVTDRQAFRRAAAVEEANAIGTFWLRTTLVPEPARSEMQARVWRYVDLHLEHRMAGIQETKTHELEAEATQLQSELWALLTADVRRDPDASRHRLVAPALNTMIDDAASVIAARENRLPDVIFLYLFFVVVVAGVVVGYRPPGEKRNLVMWAMFALVLSGILVLLLDMDRPRRGLIQSDPAPYLRLRESMQASMIQASDAVGDARFER